MRTQSQQRAAIAAQRDVEASTTDRPDFAAVFASGDDDAQLGLWDDNGRALALPASSEWPSRFGSFAMMFW